MSILYDKQSNKYFDYKNEKLHNTSCYKPYKKFNIIKLY